METNWEVVKTNVLFSGKASLWESTPVIDTLNSREASPVVIEQALLGKEHMVSYAPWVSTWLWLLVLIPLQLLNSLLVFDSLFIVVGILEFYFILFSWKAKHLSDGSPARHEVGQTGTMCLEDSSEVEMWTRVALREVAVGLSTYYPVWK